MPVIDEYSPFASKTAKWQEVSGTRSSATIVSIVCPSTMKTLVLNSLFGCSASGRLLPSHLLSLMASMVSQNLAVYEPPKQTRAVILYWRLPEEWAEVLHEWVISVKF